MDDENIRIHFFDDDDNDYDYDNDDQEYSYNINIPYEYSEIVENIIYNVLHYQNLREDSPSMALNINLLHDGNIHPEIQNDFINRIYNNTYYEDILNQSFNGSINNTNLEKKLFPCNVVKDIYKNIPLESKHNTENKVNCTICIEEFNNEDECIKLNCNHIFHSKCIIETIMYNNNFNTSTNKWRSQCPLCRDFIDCVEDT
jgi:hypothetical protein